jgi:hypothetical protein
MKTASSCTVKAVFFLLASVLLPVLGLGQNTYTPYTFITFAGSPGINGSNNGVGSAAHFYNPGGVAVDVSNNVYVADQNNGLIRKITPNGTVTTIAGTFNQVVGLLQDGTNAMARFSHPSGVTVDGTGNLIVADLNNNAIRKIRPSGTNWVTSTLAGTTGRGEVDGTNSAAHFYSPHDVAVDGAGNIFVVDTLSLVFTGLGSTIRKMTPLSTNWIVTTIAGQAGVPGIVDGTNRAALFYDPESVVVDNSGNVFVGDNAAVREITPLGTNWVVTTIAGSVTNYGTLDGTNNEARFNAVRGLKMDKVNGNLYVADLTLIRKVALVGTNWVVTTLAGQPNVRGANDGAGNLAQFNGACSVALDGYGNLYVADFYSSTIRKGFPFAITNQPQTQGATLGTNVTLGVSLYGTGPFLYQWSFGGTPLTGQTNAALPLNSVQRTNSGLYSVAVTGADTNDIVASSNAVLRVLVAPVLQPPQISSDGKLRLRFQDADGGVPFDLNSLEVQWRTNLPAGPDTNWQSLTSAFYLTNGVVEIDNTNMAGVPSGFYRVIEH